MVAHRPGPNHIPTFAGGAAMTDQQSNIPEKSTQEIPYGYCRCGCGEKTNLAPQTWKKAGWIKGNPLRYIRGHFNGFLKGAQHPGWKGGFNINQGRVYLYHPGHPRANSRGYVLQSIIIAEDILGKPLPHGAKVHHANLDKIDENGLVICQNESYHQLLHRRTIAYRACGHANYLRCYFCNNFDDPTKLFVRPGGFSAYHRECRNEHLAKNKKARQ